MSYTYVYIHAEIDIYNNISFIYKYVCVTVLLLHLKWPWSMLVKPVCKVYTYPILVYTFTWVDAKAWGGLCGPSPPPLWLVKSMISSWVSLNYKRSFNWKHKRYQSYTCWIYFNVINYDKYCRYSFIHSANLYIYLSRWNYYYSLHVFFYVYILLHILVYLSI